MACGHDATATAAREVLAAGGNAYDAAISAIAAACVAEPVLASVGGGGYLLAQPHGASPRVYDFFVHTPKIKKPVDDVEFFPLLADFGTTTQEFHIGAGSVATPGLISGLFAIHRDLAGVPMPELFAHSIQYARTGVLVREFDASVLRVVESIFKATPECEVLFKSSRDPTRLLETGERYLNPELADVLESVSIEGAALFYRGEVGACIASMLESGGHLERDDFERYETKNRAALTTRYQGADIALNAAPASGGVLTAFALTLLQAMDFAQAEAGSYQVLSAIADVLSITGRARSTAEQAGGVNPQMLTPKFLQPHLQLISQHPLARSATTHISIVDRMGNVASATLSNGESAGLVVPGTGIVLNNMLGEEDLHPGGFHRWARNARMTSMMTPTVVRKADGACIATGSGGSNRIRSAILQVLVNLLTLNLGVEEAVDCPRIHVEGEKLSVEHGIDPERIGPLLESWPKHELWGASSMFFGGAHTVLRDAQGGVRGAGDPRRGGVAMSV